MKAKRIVRAAAVCALGLASLSAWAQTASYTITATQLPWRSETSLSAPDNRVFLGDTGSITFTITNNSGATLNNGSVYISSPLEMDITALPAGCTARTPAADPQSLGATLQYMDCTLPANFANGASATITIQTKAIERFVRGEPNRLNPGTTNSGLRYLVEVTDAATTTVLYSESNLLFPFYIDPVPSGVSSNVTAVPTMDIWGLGALSALLAGVGLAQSRRRQRNKDKQ